MQTLAQWHDGGGPGPWILLFPLIWATVIAGGVILLRRTVWRGRRGPWQHQRHAPAAASAHGPDTALGMLDRRFAQGEIDEDEYWRRASVLNESVRERHGESKDGAA
ncbi:SHOCT domain-containing protein [Streptomyces sp. NBC_01186]|uniref:SHOCT domain-containing protein n=1 Tax=unclassified Streptomyces TaxID=2593676 RepID=UPI002DDB90ED|nr:MULTISPECIES: SHOCT domain-containing protein [unclassified Streptomyces]WSB74501.1 SHOCT domain-containing protein [Streptomyces sp. NBC_01775]WSS17114.1 SHOCT domain-containing protein [Streptomyces sp. NBC_01186]